MRDFVVLVAQNKVKYAFDVFLIIEIRDVVKIAFLRKMFLGLKLVVLLIFSFSLPDYCDSKQKTKREKQCLSAGNIRLFLGMKISNAVTER